jgi:hypothetical protein
MAWSDHEVRGVFDRASGASAAAEDIAVVLEQPEALRTEAGLEQCVARPLRHGPGRGTHVRLKTSSGLEALGGAAGCRVAEERRQRDVTELRREMR